MNRYWTLASGGGLTFTSYSPTFTFVAGDVDAGAATASFIVQRFAAGWNVTTIRTRTATTTQATGVTGFGDFAIGQAKANQTITVTTPAPGSAVFGTTFNVAATASSGLAVAITTTGGCSGSGSGSATITMTSGTTACVVHYNQAGNGTFNAAPEVTSTTTAIKANQTITVTTSAPASAVFGQTFSVAATASSGLTVAITTTGGCSGSGTGSASITMTSSTTSCVVHYNQAGDANYNAAPQVTSTTTAAKANTTTSITSDLPDPSVVGESVTIAFTVTANAPGAGTPSGTVTVSDADSLQICTATVAAGSCQITFAAAGTHHLTATYASDANFNGSASTPVTLHVVDKASTATTISSDLPDPSVVGETVTVTYSVSVNSPGAGTPTGTVTVTDANSAQTCSATVAAGQCTIAFTGAGTHNLTATYSGDADFNTSASTPATIHTVDKADTTTTITSDLPDPSVVGEPVTIAFSVTVDAPGAGSPTGTVTVTDADSLQTCSATVAAGSCQIAFSAAGSHNLTATYGGDADFNGSASSPATVHVVDKADTTTTITSDDDDPSVVGQTYTVTWTVSVDAPGAGSPSGTVTVGDGDGNSCAAPVGDGTCDLASTSAGAKTLTATYAGDSQLQRLASTPRPTRSTRPTPRPPSHPTCPIRAWSASRSPSPSA